jgi:hypothetical protein
MLFERIGVVSPRSPRSAARAFDASLPHCNNVVQLVACPEDAEATQAHEKLVGYVLPDIRTTVCFIAVTSICNLSIIPPCVKYELHSNSTFG